ncbi:MAG: hydroxysqualene dehydroxylase HpnE [Gemmataceae bacterium]|nr:hydroxysqualene dehydroxylase HpnE [Gemmataceae bacterium]
MVAGPPRRLRNFLPRLRRRRRSFSRRKPVVTLTSVPGDEQQDRRGVAHGESAATEIAVVGGGISGLRAALTLARAGRRVTLFEKNRHLGGRAFSFHTSDFGEVDIGQHVWLRACVHLEELLQDLGVPGDWVYRQDRLSMTYRTVRGRVRTLAAGPWPGSFGFLGGLLRLPDLSLGAKLQYLYANLRAKLYSQQQVEELDRMSMAQWLRRQRQGRDVIAWFWEPLIVGVCNARLDEVSARHGLHLLRLTVLHSPQAAGICLLRTPLSAVFDRWARRALSGAGVVVHTGAWVEAVFPGAPVRLRVNRSVVAFDRVILAAPLGRMRAMLPDVALPPPPAEGAIAGLLLRFARPVMDELFFTAVGSGVQHVFNKTAIWRDLPADGSQIIELVLSAAEREARLGADRLAAELLPPLAGHLPRVRTTRLLAKRLLVHGRATFQVPPGGEVRRLPLTWPGVDHVIFAGDFVATGLPSTMESAALAGQLAARQILAETPNLVEKQRRD